MTIVGWPLYSEFEVDKSLSGSPSSGVLQALLKEFGGSVEAEDMGKGMRGRRSLNRSLTIEQSYLALKEPERTV